MAFDLPEHQYPQLLDFGGLELMSLVVDHADLGIVEDPRLFDEEEALQLAGGEHHERNQEHAERKEDCHPGGALFSEGVIPEGVGDDEP